MKNVVQRRSYVQRLVLLDKILVENSNRHESMRQMETRLLEHQAETGEDRELHIQFERKEGELWVSFSSFF